MSPPPNLRIQTEVFDAILYDLDGTIVDTEPIAVRAVQVAVQEFGITIDSADAGAMSGRAWPAVFKWLQSYKKVPVDFAELTKRINIAYLHLLTSEIPVMPGAIACIQTTARFFKLGMVSGSSRPQIISTLGRLHLLSHFTAIFGIEDYEVSKPAPDGYLLCAKKLGVVPARCLVVEDSLPGVQSAKAAGMRVAAILAGNHTRQNLSQADWQFATLNDLLAALALS